jgi:lipoprotein NlpD
MTSKRIRLAHVNCGTTSLRINTARDVVSRAKHNFSAYCSLLILCLLGAGCESTPHPAPVVDASVTAQPAGAQPGPPIEAGVPRPNVYVVQKGDTLYSIALNHSINRKELAEWNSIPESGAIHIGQQLSLSAPHPQAGPSLFSLPDSSSPSAPPAPRDPTFQSQVKPLANTDKLKTEPRAVKLAYSEQAIAHLKGLNDMPRTVLAKVDPMVEKQTGTVMPPAQRGAALPAEVIADPDRVEWIWPAKGRLLEGFSEATKGIDIAGKAGEPVTASAGGKVVYSGGGLRGYGKLIIIKHNNTYLSAYAHNNKILVKEGQTVVKGEKIGEMGSTDSELVKLHFEIRKNGKPVDPLKHLPGISG